MSRPTGLSPYDINCYGGCSPSVSGADWGCNPPRCAETSNSWRMVDALVQELCATISTYHNMFVVSGAHAGSANNLFRDLKGCPDEFSSCDTSPESLQQRLLALLNEMICKRTRPGVDVNIWGLQTEGPIQPQPAWVSGASNLSNMLLRVSCYVNYASANLKRKIEELDPRTRHSEVCLWYELCGRVKNRSVFHYLDEDSVCSDGDETCQSFVVPVVITATVSGKKILKADIMINHAEIIRQTQCAIPEAQVFNSVTVCKTPCCNDGGCECAKGGASGCSGGGCGGGGGGGGGDHHHHNNSNNNSNYYATATNESTSFD